GSEQTCTMQVTANDGQGQTVSATYTQRVSSVLHTLTLSSGPGGSPNPVNPAGPAALSVSVTDSLNHPINYLWQANCGSLAPGTFQPSATVQNPSWTPPVNAAGTAFSCVITLAANDGQGQSTQGQYTQNVSSGAPPS